MKFDYFGEGDGHFHVDFGRHFRAEQNRIYLPEITREAQIDRSFFELRRNMYYYLKRHRNRRIRNFKIDTAKLEETLVPIRKKMVADIQKVIAYQKDP